MHRLHDATVEAEAMRLAASAGVQKGHYSAQALPDSSSASDPWLDSLVDLGLGRTRATTHTPLATRNPPLARSARDATPEPDVQMDVEIDAPLYDAGEYHTRQDRFRIEFENALAAYIRSAVNIPLEDDSGSEDNFPPEMPEGNTADQPSDSCMSRVFNCSSVLSQLSQITLGLGSVVHAHEYPGGRGVRGPTDLFVSP